MRTSIGQQLRQARQQRKISLEQVAQATRIRLHYLEAMEAGEFERLPSVVQARGFLRSYASYLGLDVEHMLASLDGSPGRDVRTLPPDPGQQKSQAAPGEEVAIFTEIGEQLRRQREILGLSLDDVERHTHLRIHYLEALESGELSALPSPVQGRGMLNNYTAFLGLDPDPLLLRFADGLQARLATTQATRPRRKETRVAPLAPAPLRRLFSLDFLLGGSLVLLLVGFVIWGVIRISSFREGAQLGTTLPSISDALMPAASSTTSPTPASTALEEVENVGTKSIGAPPPTAEATAGSPLEEIAGITEEIPPPLVGGGAVQISVVVRQRTWLRVTVDDKVELEGRVVPGSAYTYAGEDQIEILTGNGAALQVFFNQTGLGPLGIFGEVVYKVYTPQGEVLPTPTPTPIPSATIPGSPTPALSGTIQPTPAP